MPQEKESHATQIAAHIGLQQPSFLFECESKRSNRINSRSGYNSFLRLTLSFWPAVPR